MTRLYIKCLTVDTQRKLVSCFGGQMTWGPERIDDPAAASSTLCESGRIHVCRLRDFPRWVSTHNVVVEVDGDDLIIGLDKVGVRNAKIIRFAPLDGLDLLVRFAECCAEQGGHYDSEKTSAWLVAQYPAGFFDGVEE